jgi:predicted metalloendopeptidase
MFIPRFVLYLLLLTLPLAVLGQNAIPSVTTNAAADQAKDAPKLEHFDPNLADPALNACDDFYKYSCNKWLAANPIPHDEVYWSTGSGLELWNETVLRETMEAASKNDTKRGAVQQKIGDYWAACMDESGISSRNWIALPRSSPRKNSHWRSPIFIICFRALGSSATIRRMHLFSVSPDSRIMTMLRKLWRSSIRAA